MASTSQRQINWSLNESRQNHVTHFTTSGSPTISEFDRASHFKIGTYMDSGKY